MAQTPQDMYWSMSPVTRVYMTVAVGTTCAVALGLVGANDLLLSWPMIISKFQIWRLFTCFIFFGRFSLGFLFQIYFLVKYSGMLEADPYPSGGGTHQGTTADYVFMFIFCAIMMFGITQLFPMYFLGSCMLFTIIYVWSRRNPDTPMAIFGFKFPGIYTPWVLVAFHILIARDPVPDLIGIAAGHLYYFLLEVLPVADTPFKGRRLLQTPRFLADLFNHAPNTAPGRAANNPRGHAWGQGRALG